MTDDIKVSFEFFPPKTEKMEAALWTAIERLAPLEPHFVSVTYGAGGSTRERTHATVKRLVEETELKPASHLTCVGADKETIHQVIDAYAKAGVRHIVALRGDPEAGIGTPYFPHPQGYAYTSDLIEGIKSRGDFEVSVSAYPERHPESADWQTEIEVLKRKVDAGADRAITQFFFDNDLFESFVERVRKAGIDIPIVPGLAPVHNFKAISNFAAKAGASIPQTLAYRFDGLENDAKTHELVSAAIAAEQVQDLVARGFHNLHFYTMNRADLVYAICHLIGIRPKHEAPLRQTA